MEAHPRVLIAALRQSHEQLAGLVEPLGPDELRGRSYASEWSIAQVLSHLGSQAEIFGLFLDAGLAGSEPPGGEAFGPIWEAWDARDPEDQAAEWLRADEASLERFESLDDEELERFHLEMFGMSFDAAGLARMRLGEHTLHTWDIAVMLDPTSALPAPAVALLVDTLGQLAARAGKPVGGDRRVRLATSEPERRLVLEVGEAVSLAEAADDDELPEVRLPAEALVRLVYGRLDREHTPPVETRGVDLDDLRAIFPGV